MPRLPSYNPGPGFIPGIYRPNSNLAEMIMARGQQEADSQRDLYGGIAQSIAGVGQQAAGLIEQKQEQKKAEQQQEFERQREAKFMELVSDPKNPPTLGKVVGLYGPERGTALFKGMQSLGSPKPDFKLVLAGFKAAPPAARQAGWPTARQHLVAAGAPDAGLPPAEQFDNEWFDRFYDNATGAKPPEVGTTKVDVLNPDGSKTTKIVEDKAGQEFTGAAPIKEPKEAKRYEVTVAGPDGKPMKRLATEAEMAQGVPQYVPPEKGAPPGKLTEKERAEFAGIDYVRPKIDNFIDYVEKNPGKYGKWDSFVTDVKQQVPGMADAEYATKKAFIGRLQADIRHALFGSALTPGEVEYANTFTINPDDQPAGIIAKIKEASERMDAKVKYYEGIGYKVGTGKGTPKPAGQTFKVGNYSVEVE